MGSVCKAFFQLSTEPWPGFSRSCLLFSYFWSKFLRQCFACQTGSAAKIGRDLNWTCIPIPSLAPWLFFLYFFSFSFPFPYSEWGNKISSYVHRENKGKFQGYLLLIFFCGYCYLDRIQEEEKGRQETREDAGLIKPTWAMWERDISKHDQLTISLITRHFILKLFIA